MTILLQKQMKSLHVDCNVKNKSASSKLSLLQKKHDNIDTNLANHYADRMRTYEVLLVR